jgi:hypothetical protein
MVRKCTGSGGDYLNPKIKIVWERGARGRREALMAEIGHGTRRLNPSDRGAEIAITIFFADDGLPPTKRAGAS